jgi:non-homologous end joining protein Ku
VAAPAAHVAPVIDIMEALKRSLAEKRKPVAAAAASVGENQAEEAPKKRVRKSAGS